MKFGTAEGPLQLETASETALAMVPLSVLPARDATTVGDIPPESLFHGADPADLAAAVALANVGDDLCQALSTPFSNAALFSDGRRLPGTLDQFPRRTLDRHEFVTLAAVALLVATQTPPDSANAETSEQIQEAVDQARLIGGILLDANLLDAYNINRRLRFAEHFADPASGYQRSAGGAAKSFIHRAAWEIRSAAPSAKGYNMPRQPLSPAALAAIDAYREANPLLFQMRTLDI